MLSPILMTCVLAVVTVAIHVGGLTLLLLDLKRVHFLAQTRFWQIARLLVVMVGCMIVLHLAEILVWSFFYLHWGYLPDAEAAFYFSAVTYACIGYGDLVLVKPWRVLAAFEGLIGILMCGLSASVLFAVVSHFHKISARSTTEVRENHEN